jgi:hypothetical protein
VAVSTLDTFTAMVERLAANPDVPVEKLERLIAMQERINAADARSEYYAAFASMQGELPTITEKGEILVDGVLRSKYAKNEDIQEAVRPILQKHGFALTFRNEFKDGTLKITGVLAHRSGHSEQDEFVAKADTSGKKNDIQALGSTRSYGQRYTTIALLNIVSRGEDDDGRKAGRAEPKPAPEGFEAWFAVLESVASEGLPALTKAWNDSRPDFRNHLMQTDKEAWSRMKVQAQRVKL